MAHLHVGGGLSPCAAAGQFPNGLCVCAFHKFVNFSGRVSMCNPAVAGHINVWVIFGMTPQTMCRLTTCVFFGRENLLLGKLDHGCKAEVQIHVEKQGVAIEKDWSQGISFFDSYVNGIKS